MSQRDGQDDGSLLTVFRGASLFLVGQGFAYVVGFLTRVLLTNGLGGATYGVYVYGKRTLDVLTFLSSGGADVSLMRYLPTAREDPDEQNAILGLAAVVALIGSVTSAVLLFLGAPTINRLTLTDPSFVPALRAFAVLLPPVVLATVLANGFRGLGLARFHVLIVLVGLPLAQLGAVGVGLALGLSLVGIVALFVVGSLVVLAVTLWLFGTRIGLRPALSGDPDVRGFLRFTLPVALSAGGALLYANADVFVVGALLDPTAVGIYDVSLLVFQALSMPLAACNQLFPPLAAEYHEAEKLRELDRLFSTVSRWTLTGTLPVAVVAVVYRAEILSIFGASFTAGTTVLALFLAAATVRALTGPIDAVLLMTDHQYLVLANNWVLGLANVGLSVLFVQWYGLIGAAVASVGLLVVMNGVRILESWWFVGTHPFSLGLYKPLLGGVVAAGVVGVARTTLPLVGLANLVVGTALAGVAFLAVLVVLGIEPADRALYASVREHFGE